MCTQAAYLHGSVAVALTVNIIIAELPLLSSVCV